MAESSAKKSTSVSRTNSETPGSEKRVEDDDAESLEELIEGSDDEGYDEDGEELGECRVRFKVCVPISRRFCFLLLFCREESRQSF